MKKKQPKKENKQIIEIHIYVHQNYQGTWTTPNTFPAPFPNITPGTGNPIINPPYIVTC